MNNMQKINNSVKKQYAPNTELCSLILDSLQDYAIFTVDEELNINSWNSGANKIFQYGAEEILGKPFNIIFTKEDKENGIPEEEIEVALRDGRSNDVRWHQCKDGKTFYAEGLVFQLTNAEGKGIGYVKILRDITARKASEDAIKKYTMELEELNKHKETVLAILSHDLRSPLAGIIHVSDFLKSNYDTLEPDFTKKMLEELHSAAVCELNMLDYLVEWARVKYTTETFVPARIELVHYVKKVCDSLKETAAINSINFHNEIEENSSVFADEKMLMSILQNIVSNAIKHSHKGGKITLSAKNSEDKIIVEIKDTGIGMSKEMQEKLFSPQIASYSKPLENNTGAGIGLLLVKGLLEKNGGHIWVESTEGKGSSFYFTLPINQPEETMNVLKEA